MNGSWIWTGDEAPARNAYAFFRRRFAIDEPATLSLDITADTFYTLYLDGRHIGRGPARAPLSAYQYDSYRPPLVAGPHCLAVLAHHIGEINGTVMTGRPGLWVSTEAVVESPGTAGLSADADWKCLPATAWKRDLPCTMSHFGFWEECDRRQLPSGWTATDFDDSGWAAAIELGRPPCEPWGRLLPRDIPLLDLERGCAARVLASGTWHGGGISEKGILSEAVALRSRSTDDTPTQWPVRAGQDAPGGRRFVTLDFGAIVSGHMVLEFADSHAGQTVDISYDEAPLRNGAADPERTYAHFSDRFILAGDEGTIRTVHPRGFRYVTIDLDGSDEGMTLAGASLDRESYPVAAGSAFNCPDALLESLFTTATRTVHSCMIDAFVDCVTRERVQWMEDLYMHARVAMIALGDTAMTRRAVLQGAQCALPDGRINGFFPSERHNCAFASSSVMWLLTLAEYWMHTGDEDTVGQVMPAAGRLLDFLTSQADDTGLVAGWPAGQFWDWAPIENSGCLLLTNAALILALDRLASGAIFSERLERDLGGMASRLRAAAHNRFWQESTRTYLDARLPDGSMSPVRSQQANAMAALAGVCPDTEREPLLRRITAPGNLGPVPQGEDSVNEEKRAAAKGLVPVGTLWFAHWVCRALFEAGMDNEALEQMRYFWGPCAGHPQFPELRMPGANASFCHGWAGGPAYLLPSYVLGLRPVAPGWREATVEPHVGDLALAAGSVTTPLGRVDASWERTGGRPRLHVRKPAAMAIRVSGDTEHTVESA